MYEDIKFEIEYFISNIRSKFYGILQGFKNFWKYKSLIWNDRWYDYSYLHRYLRFKLNDMQVNWKDSHYIGFEHEEQLLTELVELLDTIEFIEENYSNTSETDIDNLYQEFGEKLFKIETITKKDKEFNNGVHVIKSSPIRRLWD